MKITVLGLGAMGARMATRLAAAGHDVTGWNRSPVDPAAGVKLTRTPAEAAVESELVIAMVRDDVASEAV